MVQFETQYCKLLTGELNFTGGINDPGMKRAIEYVSNQVKVYREVLDVCGYSEGIAEDYFTYLNAILSYNERLKTC